ncbi:MAG: hypothetical protein NXI01_06240 [Gammaproteobacteria bacterium]|nr:hypothetical protein [Gammaproteobacteria bacterium]
MEDVSDIQSDTVAHYVNEILLVFNQLKNITHAVERRLGAKEPAWRSLEPNGNETVRDHVLCDYAEHEVVVCPLSQDLSSNKKTFDVDHFYPDASLMDALDALRENQPLLQEIKNALIEQIGQHDANILIPNNRGHLEVTGLKHIYYNYIGNLWPISGPTNSAKGKKAAFSFSILTVLHKLESFLPLPILRTAKQQFFEEFELNYEEYEHLDLSQQADVLSDAFVQKFDEQCPHQDYILPHYINETGEFVSMLDFFKHSSIGKTALSFAHETARWSLSAVSMARSIAAHSMSEESKKRSYAKSLGMALRSMTHSSKKLLDSEGSASESAESASTDTLEGLKTVRTDLERVHKKAKDRHDNERAAQESSASHTAPSTLMKTKLNKLKKQQGFSGRTMQEHPVANWGTIHAVDGDGNCFFRAIADELERQILGVCSHRELRLQAVLYLWEHKDEIFSERPLENGEDVAAYLHRMAQDGEYAEQHILDATARMLGIQLTILRVQENDAHEVEVHPISINGSEENRGGIALVHQGNDLLAHYDALELAETPTYDNEDGTGLSA